METKASFARIDERAAAAGVALVVLADENPEALWPDGFEAAYLGIARRCGQPAVAAFSMKKAISILVMRDGMSHEEAEEFFVFNVAGAWCGPGTPMWIDDLDYDDEDLDGDDEPLGPEDLPSGLEDSWPAPDTITPTDATGATPPGTDGSTAGSTEPDASTSSASDDGTRFPR